MLTLTRNLSEGYSLDRIKMTEIGEHDKKLTTTMVNF